MWANPRETVDLVTFTEEILNRKLHFLCSGRHEDIYLENNQKQALPDVSQKLVIDTG